MKKMHIFITYFQFSEKIRNTIKYDMYSSWPPTPPPPCGQISFEDFLHPLYHRKIQIFTQMSFSLT